MILRAESGSEFIEPSQDSASLYVLFSSRNRDKGNLPFVCKTDDLTLNKQLLNKTAKTAANNKVLIRYDWLYLVRICSLPWRNEGKALAAMNATMSRVGIFNKDLAVRLVLIANNDAIVYLDAATDPYSAATTGAAGA
jgi:hypothetical protein